MRPARDSFWNPLLSLVACVAAGALFDRLRLPLPWMLGPMLAMAACNFGGLEMRAPKWGRVVGQVVIGTALGLYFTPVVAREVAALWHVLLVAAVLALVIGALCGWLLAKLSGTDRATAFFASVPGGATEMAVLAERSGARVDLVALAQSLRILLVVVTIPFTLTYSGVHGADFYTQSAVAFDPLRLACLFAVTTGAGVALAAGRMGNAFMFGPLLAGAGVTMLEIEFSSMPGLLTNAGQLLLGCTLGSRFGRRSVQSLPKFVAAVLASVAVAMVLSTLVALALAQAAGVSFPSLVLAVAPGGIAEMSITAKVLQLGVPIVTAAHVTRVIVLVSATWPMYRVATALAKGLKI